MFIKKLNSLRSFISGFLQKLVTFLPSAEDAEGEDVTAKATFTATYVPSEGAEPVEFTTASADTFTVTLTASYMGKEAKLENVEITVVDPDNIDFSGYYKKYFVGGETNSGTRTDWGQGMSYTDNEDKSVTVAPVANLWGTNSLGLIAYSFFTEGTFALYDYLVAVVDLSDYVVEEGEGNKGLNIKLAHPTKNDEGLIKIDSYKKANENGVTIIVPLSGEKCPWNYVALAKEVALLFAGEGTFTVKEFYLAAETDPATRPVTAITMTPVTESVKQGGKVTFTVKDSNYNDVTSSANFEITGEVNGCSMSSNVLTAGTTAGSVTVTAKYSVDGQEFTATSTVTVLEALTNLVSSINFEKAHLAPGWSAILDNVTDISAASEYVTINEGTVSYVLPAGLNANYQAQLFIVTDATLNKDDQWIFSCKVKGNGKCLVKLNDAEVLCGMITKEITADGVEISATGTAPETFENIKLFFDFGTCSEGTVEISEITFAKTN